MSIDNMLAVGGASHGNLFLLPFGLGLSIPFIVFTSGLLSILMDKYPVITYLDADLDAGGTEPQLGPDKTDKKGQRHGGCDHFTLSGQRKP